MEIKIGQYTFDTGVIIAFIGGFILLIWIILKLLRVFETPLIFELMPAITTVIVIFGFGVGFRRLIQKINHVDSGLNEVKQDVKINRDKIDQNRNKIEGLTRQFIALNAEFKYHVREAR